MKRQILTSCGSECLGRAARGVEGQLRWAGGFSSHITSSVVRARVGVSCFASITNRVAINVVFLVCKLPLMEWLAGEI